MTRAGLLALLAQRCEIATGESGDPRAILGSEAAVELAALADVVEGDEDYAAIDVLARTHWLRYLALPRGEDQADLDATIIWTRRLLPGIRAGDPYHTTLVLNLSSALATRYIRTGDVADLTVAIDILGENATDTGNPRHPTVLYNLGLTLRLYFGETGAQRHLHAAIEHHRRAAIAAKGTPLRGRYLVGLAEVLHCAFGHTAEHDDIDLAIDAARAASLEKAAGDATRAEAWSILGRSLLARYEYAGGLTDLTAAVTAHERAVTVTNGRDASRLCELSEVLRVRFERLGDTRDIDHAVEAVRAGLAAAPATDVRHTRCLTALGVALMRRHEHGGSTADLQAAIEAEEAAAAAAHDNRGKAATLANLGGALMTRFQRVGNPADLDRAVTVLSEAASMPTPAADRPWVLANLGLARSNRYERRRERPDLDAAISTMREAVALAQPGHVSRPNLLANLGFTLRMRFELTGDTADLRGAIELAQEAVDTAAQDDPNMPGHLSNLGNAWLVRYEHTAKPADLDRAVDISRRAHAMVPADGRHGVSIRDSFASALLQRFDQRDSLADLAEAVTVLERAVAVDPADNPAHGDRLTRLALALRRRFHRTGATADLDRAVEALRKALSLTQRDHPQRPAVVDHLSATLRTRFERTGSFADIDESIQILREALAQPTATGAPPAGHVATLASVLTTRFTHTGDMADLNEAIGWHRRAVAEVSDGHRAGAEMLSNLGGALLERFRHSGAAADIEEAIAVGRRAVAAARANDPDRSLHHTNLGLAYGARHERSDNAADLRESIIHLRLAVEARPPGDGRRALSVINLSTALERAYGILTDDVAQLDDAVALGHDAAESMPRGHPLRPAVLSNLCLALLSKHAVGGDVTALRRAVAMAREAVEAAPPGHPARAVCLNNLGLAYRLQSVFEHDDEARRAAVAAYREAAQSPSAAPIHRARTGREWAQLSTATGDLTQAGKAWDQVFDVLPAVLDRGLDRRDRQHHLATLGGIGRNAAAVAIARGDVAKAWSLLEQGRGILLGQAVQGRRETDRLRQRHPRLADEADRLRRWLNAEPSVPDERRDVAKAWQDLLVRVRALPGFAEFALPPTLDGLTAAAQGGTVVAVNLSGVRCDALLLDSRGVDHLPLSALTLQDAVERANALLAATRRGHRAAPRTVLDVLEWLWDHVTGPVLEHLGHQATPPAGADWPRIWWLPTGPLSVMPLHAAGHHDDPDTPDRRTALDRVFSSYTSTVRILHHARRDPVRRNSDALVVGITKAPGTSELPFAGVEARDVHTRFDGGTPPLIDDRATRAEVFARLERATWAHFACHAVQGDDPADGHLALFDGPLTVKDLMNRELDHPFLAYLSACTTAFGGTVLLDEAIHMTSAFQIAGFPHVLGTLWPVTDSLAPAFSKITYGQMAAGAHPAAALHHATGRIRARYPYRPDLWASHVHFGP